MFQYIAQPCDTVFSIAQKFGLDYKQVISGNPQINNESVYVGQIINIPGFMYNVRSQDTLNKISQKFNTPLNLLLALNPQIIYNGNISVGQRIFIVNNQLNAGILKQALEIESNAESIMDDIDKEDWDKAADKLTLIKNDFDYLKSTFYPKSIPTDLINIIDNAIITLQGEINLKNIHESKIQAFVISEYFEDILDILRQETQNK